MSRISGGTLQQGVDIAGIDIERAGEPGDGGGEAILAAAELAAECQRNRIAGPGGDGTVGGLQRAGNVAGGLPEAGEIGPDVAVSRRGGQRPVEGSARVGTVAQRHISAPRDPLGVGEKWTTRLRGGAERALGVALQQPRLGEEMRGFGTVAPDWRARMISPSAASPSPSASWTRACMMRAALLFGSCWRAFSNSTRAVRMSPLSNAAAPRS